MIKLEMVNIKTLL